MRLFSLVLLLLPLSLFGSVPLGLIEKLVKSGITLDFKSASFEKGLFFTEEGGSLEGPGIKIQAKKIYVYLEEGRQPYVTANGELFIEYAPYIFVGDEIEFDFETKRGLIKQGTAGLEPWFFKARLIDLLPEGEIFFKKPLITTSEEEDPAWSLSAEEAFLERKTYLKALRVRFEVAKVPIFWLPWLKGDLDALLHQPIKYRLRWGGEQGLRAGVIAEILSWKDLSLFCRLDWRFKRGPGIGLESDYHLPNEKSFLKTINYFAVDNSTENLNQHIRFRFQGLFGYASHDEKLTFRFSYDKLSDKEMATDYFEKELELKTGQKTEATLTHVLPHAITTLYSRVKLNNFQTVKQELPSLEISLYPFFWEKGGWIFDGNTRISFLDFSQTKGLSDLHDYRSGRFFLDPKMYRSFVKGPFVLSTTLGAVGIAYSKTENNRAGWLALGYSELEGKSRFSRSFSAYRHIIEPYFKLYLYTPPTLSADNHYIFDNEDGWASLQYARGGVRHLFYTHPGTDSTRRILSLDLYTNTFLKNEFTQNRAPKGYLDFLWDISSSTRQSFKGAWDFEHNLLDHLNWRLDWTFNENFATSVEYRHRSKFSWRKLDEQKFFLESFRNEGELLESTLSDRRNTLLCRSFLRVHPNVAFQFQIRRGWLRESEPSYTEYEIDLLTTWRSIWELKVSYQKRENDHRVALYFNLNQEKP